MKNLTLNLVIITLIFLSQIACSSTQESEFDAKPAYATNSIEQIDNSAKVKALLNEGSDFLNQSKFKEAIAKIQEANSILPTEDGYYLLGLSYSKKEEYKTAKEIFEKGLELNPKSEQILATYAITLTSLGEEESSLAVYTRLTEYFPGEPMYSFKRGIALKSLKRYEESYSTFKKIKEEDFKSKLQLYLYLGDVCFALKKYSEAEAFFAKAKSIDPGLQEAESSRLKARSAFLFEKGNSFFKWKNFKEAIRYFADVVKLDTQSASAFFILGKAYFRNSELEKAEENIKKSLDLEEKNKDAYINLSAIYEKKGDYQKSVANLLVGVKNFPYDTDLHNELGTRFTIIGNSKRALLAFMRTKELDDGYIPARLNIILTFFREGQVFEARHENRQLNTTYGGGLVDTAKGWKKGRIHLIGREYEDKKDWEKAEKFYLQAISKKKNDEAAIYRLSLVYLSMAQDEKEKQNLELATHYLEKSKKYNSENPELKNLEFSIKEDRKSKDVLSFLENADRFFERKNFKAAIDEYSKAYAKQKKSSTIIKIYDAYIELGQKEKILSFLKNAWIDCADNTDILETIGTLYNKLGQDSLATQAFQEILEKNPESSMSYYQLGILSLNKDRQSALRNFEKAIALKKKYTSAYIARGITYYKLGNRERAREDFYYALSIESNLEIASYNLGMILYNDNLHKDAETIFLDLTKKYPNFADPYYHLGYIYYEQKDLEQAEKYISTSLRLDRNPTTIYAYIKILEEIKKTKSKRDGLTLSIQNLQKEIVEKYPNSSYAKNLSKSVLGHTENKVVIQKYPLLDSIISPPIFINQTLIVNYGTSISRLDSSSKAILWRVETPSPYQWLKANTRLYGLSKTYLDQLDLETGKSLWRVKIDSVLPNRLRISDSILYSGTRNSKEFLYSYSFEGELQSTLELDLRSKWEVTSKGYIFVFQNTPDGMSWEIFDSKLARVKGSLTLLSSEKAEISIIGTTDNSCFLLKENFVYRFEPNGAFIRSKKITQPISALYLQKGILHMKANSELYSFNEDLQTLEKLQNLDNGQSEFTVDNNIYLSSDGVLKMRDKSGKLLWSENLSERSGKNKSGIFSVYYKE